MKQSKSNKPKVIAVMPAYNEASRIAPVIQQAKKYVDEVIVVDDGSKDNTSHASRSATFVLTHIVNMGKGVALHTGFRAAIKRGASVVVTLDADGQHDPKDIPGLLTHLKEADIVVGVRQENENMPLLFKFGNWFLNLVFRKLFHENISDTQSGFRAFRSSVYDKVSWRSVDYRVETEILANAGKHNLRCVGMPIATHYEDNYKGTTIIDGIKIFFQMLLWKMRWNE